MQDEKTIPVKAAAPEKKSHIRLVKASEKVRAEKPGLACRPSGLQ